MHCDQCREVVSAALDGEAHAAEESAAQAHLADCAPCRRAAERMTTVTRWARLAPAEVGPDIVDRVLGDGPVVPVLLPVHDVVRSEVAETMSTSECGCASSCACGCQQGASCRCHRGAA